MTPFDGGALLAMLLAFYPTPSPAALVQARAERPEYFAGATLIGHSGDKFQLPDGRIFDVIFAVDGPVAGRRWQMLEAGPGGPDNNPWPLEPGPLVPLDEPAAPAPASTEFEQVVAGAIDALGGSDTVLGAAATRVSDGAAALALVDAGGGELDDVDQVAAEIERSRSAQDFADIVGQVDGVAGAIDSTDSEYAEAPPDLQIPQEPDTPPYPGEGGSSGEPGREDPRGGTHPEGPGQDGE